MVEQMKTKTEPYVRFRGFNDDWEQVKLGDVLTERNVQHEPNEEYPLVSFTVEHGVTPKTDRYNREFLVRTSDKKYKATELNDIVYNPANLKFGAIALNTYGKAVFSPIYVTFTVNDDSDPYYMGLFVTRADFINYSLKYQEGTVYERMAVKSSDFLSLDVPVPSLPEQQKIGELFQTLDKAIDLSSTQVENLKQQKKALLQRLFPQKGETEPKVRLRGFTDEWEEVKLGDVFSVYSEKGRTDLPFVTVGERETNERTASAQGYGNDVSDKARAKAKVLLSGQFLIDLSSYGRGVYMSRMDGVTSSAYNVLNLDNGADSYWVEYLISHDFVESLKRLTLPGARQGKMIEVDGLLKTKTFVPSLDEQQAIGELFQTVDEQIRLAEDKVSQYKELKQSLQQHLFV